ncbi:MAG TPA: hypothetical protein QGG37_10875 [Chloroflexota bacterium]|nr:hypothetical protein [Chloroflexota bacterium]
MNPPPVPIAAQDPVFEPRPEPEPVATAVRPMYRPEAEPTPALIAPRDLAVYPRRAAEPAPEPESHGRLPPAEDPTASARPGSASTVATTQRPRRAGRQRESGKPSSWTSLLIMAAIGLAILLVLMMVNQIMQSSPSPTGADLSSDGSSSNGLAGLYPAPAVATAPPEQVRISVGEISLLIPADWRFRTSSEGRALVFTALSNPDDLPFVSTSLTVRIVRVSTNIRPASYDLDNHGAD